jgi:hypothetical protein
VEIEIESNGVKQKMADAVKLNTLIEFMNCIPILAKKDKNASQGMDFVINGQAEYQ